MIIYYIFDKKLNTSLQSYSPSSFLSVKYKNIPFKDKVSGCSGTISKIFSAYFNPFLYYFDS
jgi:hypothetical protein